VKSIVLSLAVALLAVQVSGISLWLLPTACQEGCDGDSDGSCPPTCSRCTCCFHPRSFVGKETPRALTLLGNVRFTAAGADRLPPSPPPREILHVPRPAAV
jgi:hypothetical protein